jgi:hypothetical protein
VRAIANLKYFSSSNRADTSHAIEPIIAGIVKISCAYRIKKGGIRLKRHFHSYPADEKAGTCSLQARPLKGAQKTIVD